MPDWQSDVWGFSTPIRQQKEKSLSLANNVPAGCMNRRSLWVSYPPPPSRPCTSTITIQVPNCTHAACCWLVHMTNYFWAYYQKSALARGSGWGEGEEEEGCTRDSKSAEALQTKERDKFLPLLTSKKNSFQLQMAAAWKQPRALQRLPVVVCLLGQRFTVFSFFSLVFGSKECIKGRT